MRNVTECLWCGSKKLEPFAERRDGIGIIECKHCGLVMVKEFPENLDEVYYNEDYYTAGEKNADSGYTETYDLMPPAFLFWQNSFIEEVNEGHAPKSFLEIGCATGNLLEILRDNQKNLDLHGIDISEYAARATAHKGFKAQAGYIEKYKAKAKHDIISSSETMEHLDNLKSFLEGVARNLTPDGTFVFYVPSISLKDAQKERGAYLRFNHNLEHLLHFTPEFLRKELAEFFDAEVLIKEFKTDFGPSIVGAVSKNSKNLANLKLLFSALEKNKVPAKSSPVLLKSLAVFALKFGQFDLAEAAYKVLEKQGSASKQDMLVIKALLGFHKGELIKSSAYFEEFLIGSPGSLFAIRSLLSNERELSKIERDQSASLRKEIESLAAKTEELQSALRELGPSKVMKAALVAREIRRKAAGLAQRTKTLGKIRSER